ncbi:TPA: hypothetical protein DEP58_04900 [Patescibacteria group bacterium]|nr:MAG: hypothetical protein UU98_C0040G0001 [Parcubacteria group bacterium GW2011_GWD2_42_14]HCC05604.1 hypothetical protein [Patescibacteria group bacterium]
MKRLSVFLRSSIFITLLFFCFTVQAVDGLPTVEDVKKWPRSFRKTEFVLPDNPNDQYGFTKIDFYIHTAPKGHYLSKIQIGLAEARDGNIYAIAAGCIYADGKRTLCMFDAPRLWEINLAVK